jgi:ribosomal protein S18 acetylase RimI-like enzyme
MAAVIDPASQAPSEELVALREIRSRDLDPLLEEETAAWKQSLDWDFQASADLVRRFIDQRSLSGFALAERGRIFGYVYFVHDEHKGLIGDLYVRRSRAGPDPERRLLAAAVELLLETPYVSRIETQLMMAGPFRDPLPAARYASAHHRQFMRIDLARARALPPGRAASQARFPVWEQWHQEAAANLIPEAYRGHIDSRINDQYDSAAGARRFLFNIVQYPGCGAFFRPASLVAIDPETGALAGVSLASLVAPNAGHITQICVAPERRGSGLGYELLRRSLVALEEAGRRLATLTVTSANREAVALYERMGFEVVKRFRAFVWEGF